MTAALSPLPVPDPPSPFLGWVGIIVPADKPGQQAIGGGGSRGSTWTPGKMLLLVPPDLLALLREEWIDDEVAL